MKALRRQEGEGGDERVAWWCPGCLEPHGVPFSGQNAWEWNGDLEKPTLSPSVLVRGGEEKVCHCFIHDGQIEFLSDCRHALAGKTVPMRDVEQNMVPDHWPADWDAPEGTWRPQA